VPLYLFGPFRVAFGHTFGKPAQKMCQLLRNFLAQKNNKSSTKNKKTSTKNNKIGVAKSIIYLQPKWYRGGTGCDLFDAPIFLGTKKYRVSTKKRLFGTKDKAALHTTYQYIIPWSRCSYPNRNLYVLAARAGLRAKK
jgi:hypothetical protein